MPVLAVETYQFWIPVSRKPFSDDAGWDQIKNRASSKELSQTPNLRTIQPKIPQTKALPQTNTQSELSFAPAQCTPLSNQIYPQKR